MRRRWLALAMTLLAGSAALPAAPQHAVPAREDLLARFLAPRTTPLVSYRALRRLSASTRGGKMTGSLEAQTSLDPQRGFAYDVTAEDGSSLIRRRVLVAALDAEQKAFENGDGPRAALTPANYEFLTPSDAPPDLLRMDVKPRRKHVMLIDGTLFLKPDSAQLVRVEGELSQRPSFWTRRVRVERQYDEIGGVHVPIAMRSTADVLLVGTSTFEMTYQYEEINGQPVTASVARPGHPEAPKPASP
jgi:hypothetical protein